MYDGGKPNHSLANKIYNLKIFILRMRLVCSESWFIHVEVVGSVVGLSHSGEGRGVELQQAVDWVQPEPTAVVVALGESMSDKFIML